VKRSVNFNGNRRTQARKAARPENLVATMNFLGMTKDEQRAFLQRASEALAKAK